MLPYASMVSENIVRVQEKANSFQDISLVAVLVPSNTEISRCCFPTRWLAVHPSSGYARVIGYRHITTDFAIEIVQSTRLPPVIWLSRMHAVRPTVQPDSQRISTT
jgi:hypothetical protein